VGVGEEGKLWRASLTLLRPTEFINNLVFLCIQKMYSIFIKQIMLFFRSHKNQGCENPKLYFPFWGIYILDIFYEILFFLAFHNYFSTYMIFCTQFLHSNAPIENSHLISHLFFYESILAFKYCGGFNFLYKYYFYFSLKIIRKSK